ncbi:MAG TPA: ribonuclease III [Caulobacteraceae bacterium]|nr:ribonuclease III [Caulobacteraceae bacterium]
MDLDHRRPSEPVLQGAALTEGQDRRASAVAELEQRLGHVFGDRALIETALTHASVGRGAADNERLEFLGDRVLALVVSEALLAREPSADAGGLSKRLHVLVSREACAQVARALGVGAALRLPGAETRRGAREQTRILADACEAVIAALYVDAGLEAARKVVTALWTPLLEAPHDERAANPKSRLQEWAAASALGAPAYRLISREGPDHAPVFTVAVELPGAPGANASAGSLQAAEKAAALALLTRIEDQT